MSTAININGFKFDYSENRAWNASLTIGLIENDDETLTLLDSEGYPSNNSLPVDHAEYILGRLNGLEPSEILARWDSYASAIN